MEKLQKYVDRLIEHFTTEGAAVLNSYSRGDITKEDFLLEVRVFIERFKLSRELQEAVLQRYRDFLWGYDVLEPLVQAPDITDIHCLRFDNIRVKQIVGDKTLRLTSEVQFESPKHMQNFIGQLAIRKKINLSDQNAKQNFVDKDSNPDFRLRCNVVTSFLKCDGEDFLYIRKEPKEKRELPELLVAGMFGVKVMEACRRAASGAIIVSGASGSGKSILMNALIEEVDFDKNILIIQGDDELFAKRHPDVVALHTVEGKEEQITYDYHDLGKNAMLLDRDYIIFSEVKGKEARDVFTAALTGHNPWFSLHAQDNRAAVEQFGNYVKMATDFQLEDIFRMLSRTPFTLIHMSGFVVDEVTRMKGWDSEAKEIIFEDILKKGEEIWKR